MKRLTGYFVLFAIIALVFTSCDLFNPKPNFDETLLVGKWARPYDDDGEMKHDYYRYDADGNGVTWVPEENVFEAEAQKFKWTLDGSSLETIHYAETTGEYSLPKNYTLTKLTSTTLEYEDDFSSYTFTKVTE